MKKFIKQSKNGTIHTYFANGKIKTIHPDGRITWKTKKIFERKGRSK
jgi:antitoxin component YwqK of YwqJK toxin-antitoxin module